ncbi:hypothetical protein CE195_00540 [Sodalis-like symbiont of Philaenus spumarius]|nr:hypothetical protein CE195_00540 [Sodalis-like symbiont of Philaenus spumarius]
MNLGILFFRKKQNVGRLFYKIIALGYNYQQALGSPLIIGLSGFNTAYVLLVALLAIISDMLFERWQRALDVSYGR